MKKLFYVIWAIVAVLLVSLILILNKELLVLAALLGPMGMIAVAIIAGVFILSVYTLWRNRGIWSKVTEIK